MKCPTHKSYAGLRRPRVNCNACWEKYYWTIAEDRSISVSEAARKILNASAKRESLFSVNPEKDLNTAELQRLRTHD